MSKRGLITIVAAIVFGFILANSVRAGVINVNPVIDQFANDADLNGVWDTLDSPNPQELLVYNGGIHYNYKSAIEFDIKGIPVSAKVGLATFSFSNGGASGFPGDTLRVSGYADDGQITLADFNRAPDPVAPLQDAFGPLGGRYQLDVTPFIQSLVDQRQSSPEFVLENIQVNQTIIHSNHNPNPAFRPLLSVTFSIPLPAGLIPGALLGLIITGHGSLRRKRTRPK
jgi:hypothetical protein